MMAEKQPYVVVHGGVHKTATSYIQSILQRNAGRLRKRGVHYIHHRDTRDNFTIPTQLRAYEQIGMDMKIKYSDEELKKKTRSFFEGIGAGPGERILISDENMTGHAGHCVKRGRPYRWKHMLLPVFAGSIPYPVTEVHLAVRNYADFFASIYVEFIRSAKGENLISEAEMKRPVLSKLASWSSLIEQLQKDFKDASIVLWRHEDFRQISDQVMSGLCGPTMEGVELAMPKKTRGRPSASHRAIAEILAEAGRNGADAAIAKRVEIQKAYPRGDEYPGYDPWTKEERAHLERLYDRDIADIRRNFDVKFLEPGAC